MNKLNLADLQVESFSTSAPLPGRGTVLGNQASNTFLNTCGDRNTCSPYGCGGSHNVDHCDTGTGPSPTALVTCGYNETCVKGETGCGTCMEPSCVPMYPGDGCGGTTEGIWIC